MGVTARQSDLGLVDLGFAALRLGEDGIMEVGCGAGLLQQNFEAVRTCNRIVLARKLPR